MPKVDNITEIFLHLPTRDYNAIWDHLLSEPLEQESAGFLFVQRDLEPDEHRFIPIDWYPVPPDGYSVRNGFHFELTDHTRGYVIKRAHDLGASVVEFHSHEGPWPACFSDSDLMGLREFVPHMWWRLRGRPYMAIVVTDRDFDGLAWIAAPDTPQPLSGIIVEGSVLRPTNLSYPGVRWHEQRQI